MTKKQRQTVIEAMRMLKAGAEEGERLARRVQPLDIGATDADRMLAILALKRHVDELANAASAIGSAIGMHAGATPILDRAKFPRAKPLSVSRKDPEIRINEAQTREDARAARAGERPRLITRVSEITDGCE